MRRVLHLLALAKEANIELKIDEFNYLGREVPMIANLAPSGTCAHHKRAGTSLCTCLYTQNIHKRQVHSQSLD